MMNNNLLRKLNEAEYGSGSLRLIQKLDEADNKNDSPDIWSGKSNNNVGFGNAELDRIGKNGGLSTIFNLIKNAAPSDDNAKGVIDQAIRNIEQLTRTISLTDLSKFNKTLEDRGFNDLEPNVMSLGNLAVLASEGESKPEDLKLVVNLLNQPPCAGRAKQIFGGKNSVDGTISGLFKSSKNGNIYYNFLNNSAISKKIMHLTNAKKNGAAIGPGEIFMSLLFGVKLPSKKVDGLASDLMWSPDDKTKLSIEVKSNNGTFPVKDPILRNLITGLTAIMGRGSKKPSVDDESQPNKKSQPFRKKSEISVAEARGDQVSRLTPELVSRIAPPTLEAIKQEVESQLSAAERSKFNDEFIKQSSLNDDSTSVEVFKAFAKYILSEYMAEVGEQTTIMFLHSNSDPDYPFQICHKADQIMDFVNNGTFKIKFQPAFNKGDIRLCIYWDGDK